jgi:fused signal recognition particle receptor
VVATRVGTSCQWLRTLAAIAQERHIPVYFIGVGEKLEDLETFNAKEFAQALLS